MRESGSNAISVLRAIPVWLAGLGTVGLLLVVALTISDVLMRWAFNAPVAGAGEVSELVLGVSITSFFPLALASGQTLSIRMLGEALGPKSASLFDFFGAVLTVVFFGLFAWQLAKVAAETRIAGETTWFLQWPVSPWWWVATVLVVIALSIQILVSFKLLNHSGKTPAYQDDPDD